MSEKEPCPHQSELVTRLGRDDAAARRDHLGECPQCQAELALLHAGFTALGEDPLPRDELAQQRIAARVMPQILADLVPVPAVAPQPARLRGRPQLQRFVSAGALTALAVVPAALYWLHGGGTPLAPVRASALALLPLCLLPAILGSANLRRVMLAGAIGLTTALMLSTVDNFDLTILRGAGCLLLAASGSLLPAVVVLRAATREHTDALSGALFGAAIGSGGATLQRLLCGNSELSHALVFHLGPYLFLIALAGLLGSRVARATAQFAPATRA